MASPEVAVPILLRSSVSTFDKFSAHPRQKLNYKGQISAISEIDWSPSFPAPADVGSVPSAEDKSSELSLPVVDLGGLRSGDPAARARIVKEICKATEAWGFFIVVNHGIPMELLDKMQEQSWRFFKLPLEMKKRAEWYEHNPRALGYKGTFARKYKEIPIKESLADYRRPPGPAAELAAKIWPGGNTEFSDTIQEYGNYVEALGLELLELLAEGLGLRRTFFSKHFQPGGDFTNTWRLHHFPRYAAPSAEWRTVPHSDPSILTILRQDVGGLQVKKPTGEKAIWIDVKPVPGSFVINVGDILEAWSNGRYPSVEHRVKLNEGSERYSMVNFLDAGLSMTIEAPPEIIDDDHPSLYKPFVARDFRENFDRIKPLGDIRKGKALNFVCRNPV